MPVFGSMSPGQGRPTDLLGLAQQEYPSVFDKLNMRLIYTPEANSDGNMLESWPVGETGGGNYLRPSSLPIDQFGVQIFDKNTTPRDVAADVVSHLLVNTDPALKAEYEAFERTFQTPEGLSRLRDDYSWARQNEGERRPMKDWAQSTRIPAYLRGYVFSQWPDASKMLTPEQMKILDQIKAQVNVPRE